MEVKVEDKIGAPETLQGCASPRKEFCLPLKSNMNI